MRLFLKKLLGAAVIALASFILISSITKPVEPLAAAQVQISSANTTATTPEISDPKLPQDPDTLVQLKQVLAEFGASSTKLPFIGNWLSAIRQSMAPEDVWFLGLAELVVFALMVHKLLR